MRQAAPDVSLRAESGFEPDLMLGLVEGRLDIAVMYARQSRPGLTVETLFEERLILVATDPARRPEPGPVYVYTDLCHYFYARPGHRRGGGAGRRVPVRVDFGGGRMLTKKTKHEK